MPGVSEGSEPRLRLKQVRALDVLLAGGTHAEAAAIAKVDVRTIGRWQRLEAFREAERLHREQMVRELAVKLHLRTELAVDTLEALIKNSDTKGGIRVMAARTILDQALRTTERADYAERLNELEEALEKEVRARETGE